MRFLTYSQKVPIKHNVFYEVADTIYCINDAIPELASFATKQTDELSDKQKQWQLKKHNTVKEYDSPTFHQKVLVGENFYNLSVFSNKDNQYQIDADKKSFFITKDTIQAPLKCDPIIALGPALILNLALNNVFCLHASACVINNKVFVFLAQSGTGKSTIARHIGKLPNHQRIADDIVPIKVVENQLTLLPKFPQLKLSAKQQYTKENLTLKTHFMFVKKDSKSKVSLIRLNQIDAIKSIINHTIATRLFNKNQLKDHLQFSHSIFDLSESYQVSYQHNSNSLNELMACINEL